MVINLKGNGPKLGKMRQKQIETLGNLKLKALDKNKMVEEQGVLRIWKEVDVHVVLPRSNFPCKQSKKSLILKVSEVLEFVHGNQQFGN